MLSLKDGVSHGKFYHFYKGEIFSDSDYKNGVRNGIKISYYDDNRVDTSYYLNGAKHGEHVMYDNQRLLIKWIYKNGLKVKDYEIYYQEERIELDSTSYHYEFNYTKSDFNREYKLIPYSKQYEFLGKVTVETSEYLDFHPMQFINIMSFDKGCKDNGLLLVSTETQSYLIIYGLYGCIFHKVYKKGVLE